MNRAYLYESMRGIGGPRGYFAAIAKLREARKAAEKLRRQERRAEMREGRAK